MTRILKSKFKFSRRIGTSLWGSAKDPVAKRAYPPGQHGMLGRRKMTTYGIQLQAKQKLSKYYNITEKQFRNACLKAKKMKGDSSENLIGLLERRLDMVVYRMNLAPTVFSARQLVSHKHVTVDGKVVNTPSFLLQPEQVVGLREKSSDLAICLQAMQKMERPAPVYLALDPASKTCRLVSVPQHGDVPYPVVMNPAFALEFYSR